MLGQHTFKVERAVLCSAEGNQLKVNEADACAVVGHVENGHSLIAVRASGGGISFSVYARRPAGIIIKICEKSAAASANRIKT